MICISSSGVLKITDGPDCASEGMENTIEIVDVWENLS